MSDRGRLLPIFRDFKEAGPLSGMERGLRVRHGCSTPKIHDACGHHHFGDCGRMAGLFPQGLQQDFRAVQGFTLGAILDLMATTGARCGNDRPCVGGSNGRQQHLFGDGH